MTENNQTYFEDMWLALEEQLSEYSNYSPSNSSPNSDGTQDSSSYSSTNQSTDFLAQQPHLTNTYEKLLDLQNVNPSDQQLHSPNLQDRINAVRDIYNKETTIIVGRVNNLSNKIKRLSSMLQKNNANKIPAIITTYKVAKNLYLKGKVAEGNRLLYTAEKLLAENFSYSVDDGSIMKRIEYNKNPNTTTQIRVQITDKQSRTDLSKQFDNISEALDFLTQSSYEI